MGPQDWTTPGLKPGDVGSLEATTSLSRGRPDFCPAAGRTTCGRSTAREIIIQVRIQMKWGTSLLKPTTLLSVLLASFASTPSRSPHPPGNANLAVPLLFVLLSALAWAAATASGTYKYSTGSLTERVSIHHAVATMKAEGHVVNVYLFSQSGQSDLKKADVRVELLSEGPLEKPTGFKAASVDYPRRIGMLRYFNPRSRPRTVKGYQVEQLLISDWKCAAGRLHCSLQLTDEKKLTPKISASHSLNCRIDCPVTEIPK